jgi:hypothetical protein
VTPEDFSKEQIEKLMATPWSSYSTEKALQNFSYNRSKLTALGVAPPAEKVKNLVVFVPISIPGMGKTTFINQFKKLIY